MGTKLRPKTQKWRPLDNHLKIAQTWFSIEAETGNNKICGYHQIWPCRVFTLHKTPPKVHCHCHCPHHFGRDIDGFQCRSDLPDYSLPLHCYFPSPACKSLCFLTLSSLLFSCLHRALQGQCSLCFSFVFKMWKKLFSVDWMMLSVSCFLVESAF